MFGYGSRLRVAAQGKGTASRGLGAVVVTVVVVTGLVVPSWSQRAAVAAVTCAAEAATDAVAAAMAKSCGARVEIDEARTELTTNYANPDGSRTLESSVLPQRARRADGKWAPINLTLAASGGLLRPSVSGADVRFSTGGTGPLVTLVKAGKSFRMSWPGSLPAPVVSGDSATYREVFADVDLVLRATRTGFTHVLVVKTPSAAADPRVRQIHFDVSGDAKIVKLSDGRLRAQAGDIALAAAPSAVMWDSADGSSAAAAPAPWGAAATAVEGDAAGGGASSTPEGPGDEAETAPVQATVQADGDLLLAPDAQMLAADASQFPLYIDPAWDSVTNPQWAYTTSNNENNDTTSARVGLNDGGARYRSFYRFPTTGKAGVSLSGKFIYSARVEMGLDHSWSCGDTPTYMYSGTGSFVVPKSSWTGLTLSTLLTTAYGHANEAGGCGAVQPDMTMNFTGNGVRDYVRAAASLGWTMTSFGFCACSANTGTGESTQDRWKRFYPDKAKLIVDYDSIPGLPNALQVAGVACPGSGVMSVGTLSPTLSANLPDADSQTLTGSFEWAQVPASGDPNQITNPSTFTKTATNNTRTAPQAVTIVLGNTYAFRVRSTDPAPYNQQSPSWSAWCQFRADTSVPIMPQVSVMAGGTIAGGEVTFQLKTTQSNVTKFRYGWSDPPTIEIAATVEGSDMVAYPKLTVPRFGTNILYAKAVDAVGNLGNLASNEINVGRPTAPVARFGLEIYPGEDQAKALADKQAAPVDTPLTATNVTWPSDTRIIGGQTASFDGAASYLSTATPVLDTSKSFSVAARVRLRDTTSDAVVVSQLGANRARFILYYSASVGAWRFYMYDQDSASTAGSGAVGGAPVVGQWTHLVGVYDGTAKTVSLYINGVAAGPAVSHTSAWNATGALNVGRTVTSGTPTARFRGEIADVQAFDRVVVDQDFTGQLASQPFSSGFDEPGMLTPLKVGNWDFSVAVPCFEPPVEPGQCEAPELGGFGRRLALSVGSDVSAGRTGDGLFLDATHWDGYATQEYGSSQQNTAASGDPVWQDTPVLRTDDSFTVSAWARIDDLSADRAVVSQRGLHESAFWLKFSSATGKWRMAVNDEDNVAAASASVDSTSAAEVSVWTHLTVVYDVRLNQIRLYVNGVLEGSQNLTFTPMVSANPLTVGRTLWHDSNTDYWNGGIDELAMHQGAMTDAAVKTFYELYLN